uniref:Latent transforming growth factor beta binding protein 4 n=1 Tax=Strigops habroptila TaxID=2489341 RepID=A0A672V314_STRHB
VPGRGGGTLTRSVYTLPLANHREEEDGAQSMVSIHVQHPPEASVTIHQVERVRGGRRDEPPPPPTAPPAPRAPPPARGHLRVSPNGEGAGYGRCFQQLIGGECSSPLPGLRTQDICCRGGGAGSSLCSPPPELPQRDAPCPPGFQRQNGSCEDVDECSEGGFCRNGLCTNTRGSFACLCPPGFLLDASRSSCISQQVLSEARGPCFRVLRSGRCALPTLRNITRQICCCSRVGKAWGGSCLRCPPPGSEEFKEICPAGPGYHYSASDLRFNTRYLGQDLTRVPLGRPRASTAAPPATREHPHPPPRAPQNHPPPLQAPPSHPHPPSPHTAATRPPRPPQDPPPGPEVIVVPRPTMGLLGPIPTPEAPGMEGGSYCMHTRVPGCTRVFHACSVLAAGNVCERNPQLCGPGRCVPHRGGYSCRCHPGFWLSTQGTHCIGERRGTGTQRYGRPALPAPTSPYVDECRRSPQPCTHGRCENTVGSYRCLCHAGYRPSAADVDECAQSPPPCTHGRCENLPGSYRCLCPGGYRAAAPGQPCQGERGPGGHPTGINTLWGSPQHGAPHIPPIDIDECENEAACPGQECLNTPGSFQCRPCREGFRLHRGRCADVDECAGGAPCGPRGRCINTEGSFRCECGRGYRAGGGAPCADINECLEGDFCFPHGECLNTDGSFTCLCAQGYTRTAAGTACTDIDECQRGGVCAGGRCTNTDGSFECRCPAGFRTDADQAECQDVDECREYGASLCGAQRCDNVPGSYRCVTECQPGYRPGDGGDCLGECRRGAAEGQGGCHGGTVPWGAPGSVPGDVDECSNNGTLCGAHATCHNLPGSFQCACDPGYETARHGHHCVGTAATGGGTHGGTPL